MTVNGQDTEETFGVQQWNVVPGFLEIKNQSEWIDGTLTPMMLKSTTGFKKMKVTVMIRGSTRQDIWRKSSKFIAELLEPCDIRLDGFDHHYILCLTNPTQAEKSLNRWHTATLEFLGYEQGEEVSTTTTAKDFTVTNEGDQETPAVIELTPLIGLTSITLNGFTRNLNTGEEKPIVIKNLTKDKVIRLDGESGLITEAGNNKFSDTELWDFPSLLPGANHITIECLESQQELVNITVKYKPRYI